MDEEAIRNYLRNTRAIIEKHGWAVQAVLGSASDGSAYSYTIGFTETLGHPEVFVAGFDYDLCRRLLNDVGSLIRDGADFRRPCLADKVIKDYHVAFRPVTEDSVRELCNAGRAALGVDVFDAVQMFLPDEAGRFPWDEGCEPSIARAQAGRIRTEGPLPGAPVPPSALH